MEFNVEQHSEQTAVVKVTGRLDASSAPDLKAALKEAAANDLIHLVIDMTAVSFIDSSGLSALVSGFKAVREHGGSLALADVGPQVKTALELTRLDRVFSMHDDAASALASLEGERDAP